LLLNPYFAAGAAVKVMTRPETLAFLLHPVDLLFLTALLVELHALVYRLLIVLQRLARQSQYRLRGPAQASCCPQWTTVSAMPI
jgi:hypothetical protein